MMSTVKLQVFIEILRKNDPFVSFDIVHCGITTILRSHPTKTEMPPPNNPASLRQWKTSYPYISTKFLVDSKF